MKLHTIAFTDFRNLCDGVHELCGGVNILYGDNAQGKTNFLEAAYVCATGRSQRGASDREMIRFDRKEAHVSVETNDRTRIDVHLCRDGKKRAAVNHTHVRRLGELFGNLLTVAFSPEDLKLIKSGPAERRRFMDIELCQLNRVYYYELQQYYRALRQRNNLLKDIRRYAAAADTLPVWDRQLVEYGTKISRRRSVFLEMLNPIASDIHARITSGRETLYVGYDPHTPADLLEERLAQNHKKDIAQGGTSAGVHRDDLIFSINGLDCRIYGSQGQQRTASLSAKLAEVRLIRRHKGHDPILLLDDVLSELDKNRQRFLLESMEHIQIIMTCTGAEDIFGKTPEGSKIMRVTDGRVE
ncbi:MAG: DNA replication/repair protein RecF [Clostridiales bacterium]|jgi:DNA replication and repair protein RecF|nr:DNA replication/repair protein RecF [Clostridiales bacterium]